jgi:hypothetical protein
MAKLTPKETMKIMLDDVVEHFSKDPKGLRCTIGEGCFYHPMEEKPNSIGCAIGMYLPNKLCKKLDGRNQTTIVEIIKDKELKSLLPKWMQEVDLRFLSGLQILHDIHTYWTDKGLSELGKEEVRRLKTEYLL